MLQGSEGFLRHSDKGELEYSSPDITKAWISFSASKQVRFLQCFKSKSRQFLIFDLYVFDLYMSVKRQVPIKANTQGFLQ